MNLALGDEPPPPKAAGAIQQDETHERCPGLLWNEMTRIVILFPLSPASRLVVLLTPPTTGKPILTASEWSTRYRYSLAVSVFCASTFPPIAFGANAPKVA